MDYFRILNLEREPFSNSPEPGLFCPSRTHVECLHLLEMAIRLRRGLNVVQGDVGTGKTTLCRKLIMLFAEAEDRDRIKVHLVLDPSFSTPQEFLSALAGFFGVPLADPSTNERQIKEAIKAALFTKGVDEDKIVLLLIDEGQKLPDFCLEILREFLNYETNDRKLLQIAIFAQTEFEQTIRRCANFADRINLYYRLNPLNLVETGRMIQYRIAQSSGLDRAPHLFTWPAVYAVYRATGGYPRAINMLCHHVVLAMIVQNRVRAGWPLVRASAGRIASFRPSRRRPGMVLVAVFLAISVIGLASSFDMTAFNGASTKPVLPETIVPPAVAEKSSPPENRVSPKKYESAQTPVLNKPAGAASPKETIAMKTIVPPAVAEKSSSLESPVSREEHVRAQSPVLNAPAGSASPKETIAMKTIVPPSASEKPDVPAVSVQGREMPSLLGQLPVETGRSAWLNFLNIYTSSDAELFSAFVQANPGIEKGTGADTEAVANIPAIPAPSGSARRHGCYIQVARLERLDVAFSFFRTFDKDGSVGVMLFPYWSSREGLVFALLLKDRFTDRMSAEKAAERLPSSLRKNARILDRWDEDTVFYRGFGDET
jgi:general secretion pathway protein A